MLMGSIIGLIAGVFVLLYLINRDRREAREKIGQQLVCGVYCVTFSGMIPIHERSIYIPPAGERYTETIDKLRRLQPNVDLLSNVDKNRHLFQWYGVFRLAYL
jgi:preprotein translocase subunit YajC